MTEYLQYFPKPFLEDVVQGRCLPFIGAGFSRNAQIPPGKVMPDWDGLGRAVADALPEYQYTTALEALSAYAHEYSRTKLVESISRALLVDSVRPGKSHDAFGRLPFERVVTTNFDFLLEQTYSAINKHCQPLLFEEQLAVGASQAGVRLFKIHGDLNHPSRLVITEEDYDSFLIRSPLFATHLSSLLIEHTALFIGYSLDDPDFRQVWQIVKERLGQLRRPAYAIQIGAPTHVIARYERRGVKVINLPRSSTKTFEEILTIAFRELLNYWKNQLLALSTATETEPQAELSLPPESVGRLAFFSVPTKHAAFYKSFVYPIVERYGFSPLMAADVIAPGDSIMAKVFALIEKAAIVIADVSSPNTLLEFGMAVSNTGDKRKLIVISEQGVQLPSEITGLNVILRPKIFADDEPEDFVRLIEVAFARFAAEIAPSLDEEPQRLLAKREYRAAVIAAFTMLEHDLRNALSTTEIEMFLPKTAFFQLLEIAVKRELITKKQMVSLREHLRVRNTLVHTREQVNAAQAKKIVHEALEASKTLRSKSNPNPA